MYVLNSSDGALSADTRIDTDGPSIWVRGGPTASVSLSVAEAEWLLAALPKLIEAAKGAPGARGAVFRTAMDQVGSAA